MDAFRGDALTDGHEDRLSGHLFINCARTSCTMIPPAKDPTWRMFVDIKWVGLCGPTWYVSRGSDVIPSTIPLGTSAFPHKVHWDDQNAKAGCDPDPRWPPRSHIVTGNRRGLTAQLPDPIGKITKYEPGRCTTRPAVAGSGSPKSRPVTGRSWRRSLSRTTSVLKWYYFGMGTETITTSLKLPADIYEAIKAEAAADHRSINAAIVVALSDHVNRRRRAQQVADIGAQIADKHGELLRRLAL